MTRRINKKTVAMVVFIISTVSKFCGVVHSGKWGLDYTAAVAFDVDDTLKAVWGFILGAVLPIESCGWVRWGILWSSELFSWFLETFIVSVSYNFKLWVFFPSEIYQLWSIYRLSIFSVVSLMVSWLIWTEVKKQQQQLLPDLGSDSCCFYDILTHLCRILEYR